MRRLQHGHRQLRLLEQGRLTSGAHEATAPKGGGFEQFPAGNQSLRTFDLTKLPMVSVVTATLCFLRTCSATLAINSSSVAPLPCQRQAWSWSLQANL